MADSPSRSQTPDVTTSHRTRISDPDLPGLPLVLDGALLLARLKRAWGAEGLARHCLPTYIRYKPHTSCIACYALPGPDEPESPEGERLFYAKCYRPAEFEAARDKAMARSTVPGSTPLPVTSLDDLCTLVFAFPNDAELDGLQVLAEPKKLQRLLYELVDTHPESEWRISDRRLRVTPVRYKPEKRAVLRLDTRAVHRTRDLRQTLTVYARTYVDDRGADVARMMSAFAGALREAGSLRVPRPFGYHGPRRMLLVEALEGVPLRELLATPEAGSAVERVAIALSRFHGLQIEPGLLTARTADNLLGEARAALPFLQNVSEGASRDSARIVTALEGLARRVERGVQSTVHGDFHQGQVLLAYDSEAVIDFDRSYAGDPVADVGNFQAHLRLLQLEGRIDSGAHLHERFASAYAYATGDTIGTDALRFWSALGLLQLAVRPFRTLEDDWQHKVERILAICLEGLA